jgi:hypothetical protein
VVPRQGGRDATTEGHDGRADGGGQESWAVVSYHYFWRWSGTGQCEAQASASLAPMMNKSCYVSRTLRPQPVHLPVLYPELALSMILIAEYIRLIC